MVVGAFPFHKQQGRRLVLGPPFSSLQRLAIFWRGGNADGPGLPGQVTQGPGDDWGAETGEGKGPLAAYPDEEPEPGRSLADGDVTYRMPSVLTLCNNTQQSGINCNA